MHRIRREQAHLGSRLEFHHRAHHRIAFVGYFDDASSPSTKNESFTDWEQEFLHILDIFVIIIRR